MKKSIVLLYHILAKIASPLFFGVLPLLFTSQSLLARSNDFDSFAHKKIAFSEKLCYTVIGNIVLSSEPEGRRPKGAHYAKKLFCRLADPQPRLQFAL